jgi:hypothetical protein
MSAIISEENGSDARPTNNVAYRGLSPAYGFGFFTIRGRVVPVTLLAAIGSFFSAERLAVSIVDLTFPFSVEMTSVEETDDDLSMFRPETAFLDA